MKREKTLEFARVSKTSFDTQNRAVKCPVEVTQCPLDCVKAEIKKCIVLCANCHAIRHWTERKASQSPSIAAGIAEAEQHLKATRAEREAYELVFGTSGDPDTEYRDYQEYYGVDPKNRRER